MPFTQPSSYYLAGKGNFSRRYIWIGTETFPVNLKPELHQTALGAIKVEPYSDDTQLLNRFKDWLNQLTRSDLPEHRWSDE